MDSLQAQMGKMPIPATPARAAVKLVAEIKAQTPANSIPRLEPALGARPDTAGSNQSVLRCAA
jgi:hypothetical protein